MTFIDFHNAFNTSNHWVITKSLQNAESGTGQRNVSLTKIFTFGREDILKIYKKFDTIKE